MLSVTAKTLLWIAILVACLLLPAQTIRWPAAWALLGGYAVIVMIAFWKVDPDLLRERTKPGPGVERSDAVIAAIGGLLLYPATLIVAGLDHAGDWSPRLPLLVTLSAFELFFVGYGLALWAMHHNRFFSTFVRIQTDRGHHLIDQGPYAMVRHPGYTGTLLAHTAMPVALGSLWALVPAAIACAVFVLRTALEDRTLANKLPGYQAYRHRVKWRLVPWVW